jgi:hypothetical protein
MFARSTTLRGRPESVDSAIAFVRDEVMPAAMELDGWVGLSMICSRETGRCISTTAWATQDALNASEQMMEQFRGRVGEIVGATPSVDRWEIAVLHRDATAGDGASVRCTWLSMDPEGLDHAIQTYRMSTLPGLEELDGFCSASLMVDRSTGRLVSSATFASRDAMVASRSAAESLRTRVAQDIGATVTDVEEFELALAHLHVPEMA